MPTYHVYVNQGKLSARQKKDVAAAVTEGHARMTGAPKYYVQVIIDEIPDENRFVGGIPFNGHMWIRGDVRCRTPDANKALMMELIGRVSKVCDFDGSLIWCDLCNIEPANIVKFGTVFPPAGEEKAWHDALPREVKEIIQKLDGKT